MTAYDRLVLSLVRQRARDWMHLRAWGGRCLAARVEWHGPRPYLLGLATPACGRIEVYLRPGTRLAEALGTVLHELAHVAAGPRGGHGPIWRSLFARGVEEVTGRAVDEAVAQEVLDRQAVSALAEVAS